MKRQYIAGILAGLMVLSQASVMFADEEIVSEEVILDAAEVEQVVEEDSAIVEDTDIISDDIQISEVSDSEMIEDTVADEDVLEAADGTFDDDDDDYDDDDDDDYDYEDYEWVVTTDPILTGKPGSDASATYTWYDMGTEVSGRYACGAMIEIEGANIVNYIASFQGPTHFYKCVTNDAGQIFNTYFQVYDPNYLAGEKYLSIDTSTNFTLYPLIVRGYAIQYMTYKITPAVTGPYTFTAIDPYGDTDDSDPIAYFYAPDGTEICRQDDGAEGYNFQIIRYLEAGRTYTLNLGYYDYNSDGDTGYYGTYPVAVSYGAAPHNHDRHEKDYYEANCGHGEYAVYECTICGETWTETFSDTVGAHVWGPWVQTIPADTDRPNTAVATCQVCGMTTVGSTVPAIPVTISKAPSSLKAKAASKGKVSVTWSIKSAKKSKKGWKGTKKIELQYGTDPTFVTKTSKTYKKTAQKATLKLAKNTTYYIRVRFTDGKGGYSKWVTKKVKTKKK